MNLKQRLLKLLNIHQEEWWIVSRLFVLQFFQGAGIAIFYTAASSIFIEAYSINLIPYVYVISAILLWISGSLYSYFESTLDFKKFHGRLIIFMTVSVCLWSLLLGLNLNNKIYFIMFAWFNVLYVLNNLHFWGIAATIFDLRQSKRLFGVVSAGDIPAKLLGYASASVLATFMEPDFTIIISGVIILSSLYTWQIISRSGHIVQSHHEHTAHEHDNAIMRVINFMMRKKLVLHLAIMSVIVYCKIGRAHV